MAGELTIQTACDIHQQLTAVLSTGDEAIARNKILRLVAHSDAALGALGFADWIGFFGDPVVLRKGEAS